MFRTKQLKFEMCGQFTPEDTALVLVDYQVGTLQLIRSSSSDVSLRNAVMLASAAARLKIPIIMTSSQEDHIQGRSLQRYRRRLGMLTTEESSGLALSMRGPIQTLAALSRQPAERISLWPASLPTSASCFRALALFNSAIAYRLSWMLRGLRGKYRRRSAGSECRAPVLCSRPPIPRWQS